MDSRHFLRLLPALLVGFSLAHVPSTAAAQECFISATAACDRFGVVQIGLGKNLRSLPLRNPTLRSRGGTGSLTIAWMTSLSSRHAIGGGLVAGANENDGWIGLQGRYRLWLTERRSLDVAVGVARAGPSLPSPMPLAEIGFNVTPSVGLSVRAQTVGTRSWMDSEQAEERGPLMVMPSLSAHLGGKPGVVATLIAGGLFGAAWLAAS